MIALQLGIAVYSEAEYHQSMHRMDPPDKLSGRGVSA
jgi:hypothetical protein